MVLSLNVNTWDKLVHIQIYMGQRVAERLLEDLQEERETIESELGGGRWSGIRTRRNWTKSSGWPVLAT